jgi:hypothetical protein
MLFLSILFSVLSVLSLLPLAIADAPQTAVFQPVFSSFRPCAGICFYLTYSYTCPSDKLADALGCGYHACSNIPGSNEPVLAQESCWCRADLQPVAERYISSCISSACTQGGNPSIDIKSAVDFYDGYCSGKGYSRAEASPTDEAATSDKAATTKGL